jgi:hypothetical protein
MLSEEKDPGCFPYLGNATPVSHCSEIPGSAGILPAFRAAIPHILRAGCPRSQALHGFWVPVSRRAWTTALRKEETPQ